MKPTLIIRSAIFLCLTICLGCSKDSIGEEKEEFTIYFIVKDKNTKAPISNAEIKVIYNDRNCIEDGCEIKYASYGPEMTDSNGGTYINISKIRHLEDVYAISCKKDGYKPFGLVNVSLNFYEIYLKPN